MELTDAQLDLIARKLATYLRDKPKPKTCPICEILFRPDTSRESYCSTECADVARQRRRKHGLMKGPV